MSINFHYEQQHQPSEFSHILIAEKLFHHFQKKYPDIEFVKKDFRQTDCSWPIPIGEFSKFKHMCGSLSYVIIENDETKKYFLFTCTDKLYSITSGPDRPVGSHCTWDLENCMDIFPIVGVHNDDLTYSPGSIPYTPYSYVQFATRFIDITQELYKLNKPKIIPDKPHVRYGGEGYLFRKYLYDFKDSRFNVYKQQISYEEFFEEMNINTFNIEVNSVAEVSGRMFDSFGLGCAVIRPKLTIKYHNELIPDYHYAAVRCDDISDYPSLADSYIERFEELKKDKDLVHFLSINGRKWYEENCTIESHVNLLDKLIDLNKLL